ncbi:P-loop containing nucleoside triphosphate hydrolase protein [Diaporthe sp. PMI_573]|nr:P-loop containing nucleoside triphosphate hydrolase protein [Diaporthaceae sp. PMI_573]
MAILTRWVQKLLSRAKNPRISVTAPQAPTTTNRAGKDGPEQTMIRPRCPTQRAVHERHLEQGHRARLKCAGSGSILAVLLGSPGIGRRSLQNKLLYDDMHGGELFDQAMFAMEDEMPRYLCGENLYNILLLMSASDSVWSHATSAYHDFFSVILAYDICSQASFDEVSLLYDTISVHQKSGQRGIHLLILGLKADLDGAGRRVSRETGEAFAVERGCSFAECSAKSGDGVYEAFGMVVESAHSIKAQYSGDPEGHSSFINDSYALWARAMQSVSSP